MVNNTDPVKQVARELDEARYGIEDILSEANPEFFNIMIWNMKLNCQNIINNGAYKPETKDSAVRMISEIDRYTAEANKLGL